MGRDAGVEKSKGPQSVSMRKSEGETIRHRKQVTARWLRNREFGRFREI